MALINFHGGDIPFEKVLLVILEDSSIQNVELIEERSPPSGGQNFLSKMTQLCLKYTCIDDDHCVRIEKRCFLILKEEPEERLCLEQVRSLNVFETELPVLQCVLPKIEELVGMKIGPKCAYGSEKPPRIIMEDLSILGFRNKNLHDGFTEPETLMVIEKIAKFHAGSIALNEQQPGYCLENFSSCLISEKTDKNILKMMESFIRSLGDIVSKWSDEKCARTAHKFKKLSTIISKRLKDATKYDDDEFCVLNHGDCWMDNIMFHGNEKDEPVDVRLVDFQMSTWSSPAVDLLYFLSVCPQVDIKCSRHDFFLQRYLTILGETMLNLGCKAKILTIDELTKSMKKRGSIAVRTGIIFLSKIMSSVDGPMETLNDVLERGYSDMSIFDKPAIIEAMKKIILWMDERGFLD